MTWHMSYTHKGGRATSPSSALSYTHKGGAKSRDLEPLLVGRVMAAFGAKSRDLEPVLVGRVIAAFGAKSRDLEKRLEEEEEEMMTPGRKEEVP